MNFRSRQIEMFFVMPAKTMRKRVKRGKKESWNLGVAQRGYLTLLEKSP